MSAESSCWRCSKQENIDKAALFEDAVVGLTSDLRSAKYWKLKANADRYLEVFVVACVKAELFRKQDDPSKKNLCHAIR